MPEKNQQSVGGAIGAMAKKSSGADVHEPTPQKGSDNKLGNKCPEKQCDQQKGKDCGHDVKNKAGQNQTNDLKGGGHGLGPQTGVDKSPQPKDKNEATGHGLGTGGAPGLGNKDQQKGDMKGSGHGLGPKNGDQPSQPKSSGHGLGPQLGDQKVDRDSKKSSTENKDGPTDNKPPQKKSEHQHGLGNDNKPPGMKQAQEQHGNVGVLSDKPPTYEPNQATQQPTPEETKKSDESKHEHEGVLESVKTFVHDALVGEKE